ncbi:P-loop containing nucleoside triphosphate hydrolase protein [Gorgonomyces haynaldii]|nr:P-loop containing nucleoside triphosphate hydrolase protein [Gorgonomyces haynaldii]
MIFWRWHSRVSPLLWTRFRSRPLLVTLCIPISVAVFYKRPFAEAVQVEPIKQIPLDIKPEPEVKTTLVDIWNHLKHEKLLLGTIIVVTAINALINIQIPIVIGKLISIVQAMLKVSQLDMTLLNLQAFRLMTLFLAQGGLTFVDIALVSRLGENLSKRMRTQLYRAILSQDMGFFDINRQGNLTGRLTQDISDFKHTFKLVITQGLKCVSQIIGSGISLVTLSPTLTFNLLTSMPVLYLFMNGYGIYLRNLSKHARSVESEANGIAAEALGNIKTVRAFAAEEYELERYEQAVTKSGQLQKRLGFHIGLFQGMTNASIGSMILVILYTGGRLVAKGEMSGGDLMAYMVATQNTQKSLALVGVLFGQVIKSLGSAARVFEYVHQVPLIPLHSGIQLPQFRGQIEFQHVDFTYPSRPDQPILGDFTLEIPYGKVVALCGASGAGKSTVGQLIERFYDADHGRILIDGADIKQLDPSWLRKHIGYINQEPVLFAGSIIDNIRYGTDCTDEQVYEAAKQANAHDFISSFPNGYETMCGERGVTLSGGQKQRVAIARALLKNPQVLILDEATSALDPTSEKLVQGALDNLMKNRTVLVIAHRLSTIANADLIVVMGPSKHFPGNIVEKGTHTELLKKKGYYWRLYNAMTH